MLEKIKAIRENLNVPLDIKSRVVVLVAAFILIPSFVTPLWKLDFGAQQYPEGLEMYIYPDKMVGGDDGNDLTEINVLNHYIGMEELRQEDFTEFKWIPLVIGLMLVLAFRAAAIGTLTSIIDIFVFMIYFAAFSFWRFWSMLHSYGYNLDPKAAVQVAPFTPPVLGSKMVGQFSVTSFPSIGGIFLMLFGLLIVIAIFWELRKISKTI